VIADEVQSGFGRLGAMWGHELLGMRPDIVTLGKPVGNGHPLGVVITSRAILDEFQAQVRLFSTFGGNPVSCAAGLAVLDVIGREDLITNSRTTGDYLRERLRELAATRPLIGDVRGKGLLAGLELVTDRETKAPATTQTLELLELMRENGALVGKDGEHAHILKLRPPLVTTQEHVDVFIDILDRSLAEVSI
jgi:4-aminobutyrate aminotransferase-like enzyme